MSKVLKRKTIFKAFYNILMRNAVCISLCKKDLKFEIFKNKRYLPLVPGLVLRANEKVALKTKKKIEINEKFLIKMIGNSL